MSSEQYYFANDCPNCGQKDEYGAYKGARMGSTSWGHSHMCCSNACGIRLGQRLKSGMITEQQIFPFPNLKEEKLQRLRIEIKKLKHQHHRTT